MSKKKYAVIKLKGTQYVVSEGDEFLVDKIQEEKADPKVLMIVGGGKVNIGKPELSKSKVKIKIVDELVKGKKLSVRKFKAKSRYRKKQGFRPLYSKIRVEKITS